MMRSSSSSAVEAAAKPFYLRTKPLILFMSFVNLLNFIDRGVIPGATNEVNSFIDKDLHTDTPDVYLGLLQSSFVIGYMVGSLLFGHLIHHYGRFTLTAIGCSIWIVAVTLSGIAAFSGSYVFLLLARVLSGFGEAGLQCSIPPWIQSSAPREERGQWLAIFYTAIPVGTALGYALSSVIAQETHWGATFFLEAVVMLPLVVFMFFIAPHFPCDTLKASETDTHECVGETTAVCVGQDEEEEDDEREGVVGGPGHHALTHPSVKEEFLHVMDKTLFLAYTAAYAAQTAALIGVSTFGSAFLMGLGFFDSESEASTTFGALISLAGIVATPLGGLLLDRSLRDEDAVEEERDAERLNAPLLEDHEAHGERETEREREGETEREKDFAEREDSPHAVHAHIRKLSLLLFYWSLAGALLLSIVFVVRSAALFLTLVALGSGFIFLCNAAINMGVMLSVPPRHRAFAIALNVVCLHAFGDVPSPIIVGLIKDRLAPNCNASGEDDAVAASDACRDDAEGLRVTMLCTTLWLLWTAFFCWLAYALNERRLWHVSSLCGCARPDDRERDREREREDEKRRSFDDKRAAQKKILSICAVEESNAQCTANMLHDDDLDREKVRERERERERENTHSPLSPPRSSSEEAQRRSVERFRRISRERDRDEFATLGLSDAHRARVREIEDCVEI